MSLEKIGWKDVEKICREMYADNPYLSPYQEYSFLTRIMNSSNIRRRKEFQKFQIEIFVFNCCGQTQAVLPLYVNYKNRELCLIGEFASVGHLDFIYGKEFTLEMFSQMLQELAALFGKFVLKLNRISQFSKTAEFLRELKGEPEAQDICVKIDFTNRDEWYQSLSKSCRQNIRTSHNRLSKDNCRLEYRSDITGGISKKLWDDNLKLFSRRICEHCKLPAVFSLPMYFLKKNEALTKALFESDKSIVAGIYMNGIPVAACNGIIGNDGRAVITRLSTDLTWGKYSPGGLLIESMIEELSEKHPFVSSIDLSRGDEPYKYTYGGKEFYNYSYTVAL